MSEETSLLKSAFDAIDGVIEKSKQDDYKMMILGIEFDSNGMPISRGMRCSGSPAMVLAAITLLIRMLEDQQEETLEKIDQLGNLSNKLEEMMSKLGIDNMEDPEFLKMIESSGQGEKFKKLIRDLKNKFGK